MTLINAVETKEGIILACDSRATGGGQGGATWANDTIKKLYKASDHVGLLTSGANELCFKLIDELLGVLKKESVDGVTNISERARTLFRERYGDWFRAIPDLKQRPGAVFIFSGYDPDPAGEFTIQKTISMEKSSDFAPQLFNQGFAMGGLFNYAVYLFNRLYKRDISLQDAIDLTVYTITETMTQDGRVGGPIRVAIVTPEGYRELKDAEISEIIEKNEKRTRRLNRLFFGKSKKRKS